MRRILMAGLVILFALGAPAIVKAQPVSAAAVAQVKAILAQYPDGGPGLQAAIAAAVEANPTLAAAVVAVAPTANTAQQQELGLGLAEAAAVLQTSGTPEGIAAAQQIQLLAASGPPALLAAFTLAGGTTGIPIVGGATGTSNLSTSRCISPSGAGRTCPP